MKCTCCGKIFSDNDRYCPHCGQNNYNYKEIVKTEPIQIDNKTAVPNQISQSQICAQDKLSQISNPTKRKSKKGWDAYMELWRNYGDFSGTMVREEFWTVIIINVLFSIIPIVGQIYAIFAIIGILSCSVRRLHDTGRSGRYLLLLLLPIIGLVMVTCAYLENSNPIPYVK